MQNRTLRTVELLVSDLVFAEAYRRRFGDLLYGSIVSCGKNVARRQRGVGGGEVWGGKVVCWQRVVGNDFGPVISSIGVFQAVNLGFKWLSCQIRPLCYSFSHRTA